MRSIYYMYCIEVYPLSLKLSHGLERDNHGPQWDNRESQWDNRESGWDIRES